VCTKLEHIGYDMRTKVVSTLLQPPAASHVVVVAIKEQSILAKKPFVFWYPEIGKFCSLMAQMGASAIGIDLIPVHSLEQKFGGAYLGAELSGQGKTDLALAGKVFDQLLMTGIMEAGNSSHLVQGVSGSTIPFYYDLLAFMGNATPASLRLQADGDSIIRSQPGRFDTDMLSFPAELVRASGSGFPFPPKLHINYRFLPHIPVLDFEDLLAARTDPGAIKNRIVILGLLSAADDIHETSIGARPGMLIHATTIETLLSGKTINPVSLPISLLLMALLCGCSFPLANSPSPLRSLVLLGCCASAFTVINVVCFASGIVIPLFPHAAIPFIMFCITYPYRYVVEERGKRKLYQAFSYYVSPEVIDRLVVHDAEQLMKGERHNVCIMFLDIRGFTALSEKYESESIVAMLNIFFEQVTEVVQNHGGFVNKFIGDGMLAFFTPADKFVDAAIEASLEICRLSSEMNSSGILQQYIREDTLAVGIGLHAGSVILGNIGSRRKMDFTVIGRAVNAASRIESLTKEYSRPILVSSEVQALSHSGYVFEALGTAQVKGIAGGVEIFGLSQNIDQKGDANEKTH